MQLDILKGLGTDSLAAIRTSLSEAMGAKQSGRIRVDKDSGAAFILSEEEIQKDATQNVGVNVALGLAPTPLQGPAKYLVPILTPLRNALTRTVYRGPGKQYKRITGINTKKLWGSTAEANPGTLSGRNGFIALDEKDATISWKKWGIDNFVTEEARTGSSSTITPEQDFDAEGVASITTLQGTMLLEEQLILGGNTTALAAPAACTRSTTQIATGLGSLTAATQYFIRVSVVTLQGLFQASTGHTTVDVLGETNAPNESTTGSLTPAGGNPGDKSLAVQVVAIPGAVAYNWFFGTTTGNGNCKYVVTTPTNRVTFNSTTTAVVWTGTAAFGAAYPNVSSTNVGNTVDKSPNTLDFDGLIYQAATSSGSYYKSLEAAPFTSDSKQGVVEILALLKSMYDNNRVSPTSIWVSSTERDKINSIIVGTTSPVFRVDISAGANNIVGGLQVSSVLNPYFGIQVPIYTHPNMPPGTLVAICERLGQWYPTANIPSNLEMGLGYDYQRYDYAYVNQAKEMGVYARGALITYAPFAIGTIQNIG